MSLLIDGTPTFNIARSQGPTTLVSSFFVQTYFLGRQASSSGSFALTLNSRDHGPLTVVLSCRISSGLEFDVVLALDWKSHLRDLLLHFGHRVPAAFDPWSMLSGYVASLDAGVSGAPLDSSVSLEPSQSTGMLAHPEPVNATVVVKPVKNVKTVKPVKPVLRIGDAAIPSAGGADASAGGADVAASCNLSRNQAYYFKIMQGHGIPSQNLSSLPECKQAILTHLLSGGFDDSRDLAYFTLSIIISSRDLLNAMPTLASIFGINGSNTDLETWERRIRAKLLSTRSSLVEQFTELHPAERVLERINAMPLASLISIAALHGIPSRDCSQDSLRNVISTHLLSGACGSQRFGSFSIGFPSGSYTQEEFEQALQIRLLSQILPKMSRAIARKFLRWAR
ncbi:hypothetical protein R3P38DRAFT_2775711 [Favolaschia claudopus]|uniref:Uncharacterized protein n=1 Tax=Favolaschia claudopus TaxID=2862362 RepID=A0AAW0BQD3_9AGAR